MQLVTIGLWNNCFRKFAIFAVKPQCRRLDKIVYNIHAGITKTGSHMAYT